MNKDLKQLLLTHYNGERAREAIVKNWFPKSLEAVNAKDADALEEALRNERASFEEALIGNINELPGNEREVAFLYWHRLDLELTRIKLMSKYKDRLKKLSGE
jgi:hypothetical protein